MPRKLLLVALASTLIGIGNVFADAPELEEVLAQLEQDRPSSPAEANAAYGRALTAIEQIVGETPDDAEAHYHRGRMLFYLERDEDAESAYRRSIELAPDVEFPRFMLGVLLGYTGDNQEAEEVFRALLEENPDHRDAHKELVRIILRGDGREEDAKEAIGVWLENMPEDPEAHHQLGRLLPWEEALPHHQKAAANAPDEPLFAWNLAQAYQLAASHPEAKAAFLRYDELQPGEWRTMEKLVQCCEATDDADGSATWREKLAAAAAAEEGGQLAERGFFVREQFAVDDLKIFAIEYFELRGDRAVKYSFNVRHENEDDDFRVSLGSYKETHQIAVELGEIEPDERRYHLDGYFPDRHETYAMFNGNPGYPAVKAMVIEVIQGDRPPFSATIYKEDGGSEIELNLPERPTDEE